VPDLLPGSTVRSLDTPPTVSDSQPDSYTFTNNTFGVATTGGTYADCGVAFVAPTTGRVIVDYAARITGSDGAAVTSLAFVVRTGATVGSGTDVHPADANEALQIVGTDQARFGASTLIEGLTPGASYNVRLEHVVSAGDTGTALRRSVIVAPAT